MSTYVRVRWLLATLVLVAACMTNLEAYAQTYSVSGTVTLTASQTLPKNRPNACVTVTLTRSNGQIPGVTTTINTDAAGNGTYSFTGLPTGDFTVSAYAYELTAPATCTLFPATATSRVYTLKFYDGTANSQAGMSDAGAANYFTLSSAHQSQTINFNLVDTTNGRISGTVTEVGGGTISGATVSAYVHSRANFVQSVTTNASGVFTIPGLPPGRYGIGANASGHAVKYYMSAKGRATYTPITVTAGITETGKNIALDTENGSISGFVRDVSSAAVTNVCVAAMDKTSGGFVRSGCPDLSTGAYTINRLAPGTYRLRVFHAEQGFVNQYYGNGTAEADFEAGADVVVTNGGNNSGKNITMAANPGQIRGNIRVADSGAPIGGAGISVRTPNGNWSAGGDSSHADGSFLVRGLAPGVYRVRITHPAYGTRWFTFSGGTANSEDAGLVPVVANGVLNDVNVDLDPNPGSITGRVTTDAVPPVALAGYSISVASTDGLRTNVTGTTVQEDGTYEVLGLDPGTYIVRTNMQYNDQAPTTPAGHAVLYYDNKGSRETADTVTVAAGTATQNINLIPSATFGSLSGRVTKIDGTTGLALVGVLAFDAAGNRVWSSETDSTGAFTISQLPPGNYRVRATLQGYGSRYFLAGTPGTPDLDLGTAVPVSAAANYSNVNIKLEVATSKVGAYRPSDGTFYLDYNGNGVWEGCGIDRCLTLGLSGDKPLIGDWDGTGTDKVGFFRPGDGTFYLDFDGNGKWGGCGTGQLDRCLTVGMSGDTPLVGDWSGSGKAKIGAFRPSDGMFYLDVGRIGIWDGCDSDKCVPIGLNGDVPLVGDWSGTGSSKVGAFRPSDGYFYLDSNGNSQWDGCGIDLCLQIGLYGDIPLVGDWNGDGRSKVGTFRPSDGYFYLDYNGNGQWDGCGTDRCLQIGLNGDIPLVGDWNGTGTDKVGAFRPSDGFFYLDYNGSGTWDGCGTDRCLQIGLNGDIPFVGKW